MPRKIRLFIHHRGLLIESFFLILRLRVHLTLKGPDHVRRLFCRAPAGTTRAGFDMVPFIWSVRHAARLVPRASCLTQAFALQSLLLQRGVSSTVRIGVRRSEQGQFQAHAWLVHQDRTVLGEGYEAGPDFVRMVDLEPLPS